MVVPALDPANRRTIRIGFVGVGSMGQCAHLKNYVTVPGCEVVALAELREDLGTAVAARYGVPTVYTTMRPCWRTRSWTASSPSQPFDRHGVLVPELLKAGVPVFTEKPLAASVEVGRADRWRAVAGQRHLAHGRLPQAQRPGDDARQGRDRPAQGDRASWAR